MRVADVSVAVAKRGGPSAYVEHVMRQARGRRHNATVASVMDEVHACGGLGLYAAALVADALVVDTTQHVASVTDLGLALDHARALLLAVTMDELAGWALEGIET
jgi:hypothetical protein